MAAAVPIAAPIMQDVEEKWGWHSGKNRRLFKKVCAQCSDDFWIPKHVFDRSKYCSSACHGEGLQRRSQVSCAQCGKPFSRATSKLEKSRSGLSFCNRKCKEDGQAGGGNAPQIRPSHYGDAQTPHDRTLRARLIKVRGHRCERCGLSEWLGAGIPLEMDHVDGNAFNNDDSNLLLLCRNCHGLTSTFAWRNHGRGRKSRINGAVA